jgi:hypothetical protein
VKVYKESAGTVTFITLVIDGNERLASFPGRFAHGEICTGWKVQKGVGGIVHCVEKWRKAEEENGGT